MQFFALAILGAVAGIVFFFTRNASAAEVVTNPATPPAASPLRAIYEKYGARFGIDPDLLQAFAQVESSENPAAVRWKPPRDVSAGLMQILCIPPAGVAEGDDFKPTNKFNIEGWADATFSRLLDPDFNVLLGAQIAQWNLAKFGYPRGVAVYNSWNARLDNEQGPFQNQVYVDRVLKHLSNLKGE